MNTNNHLKNAIKEMNNFMTNNTQPPEDLAFTFISELRVSNLLIPANLEGENISFPHLETGDGSRMLPLFTDGDEMAKYSKDFAPLPNDLEFYVSIVDDLDLNGAVINPMSDDFFVDRQLLGQLPGLPQNVSDDGADALKLKEMVDGAKNEELRAFIADDTNFNNFTDFPVILKRSVLLNVVIADDAIDDEVISRFDAGGFVLSTIKSGRDTYCALFTGRDVIDATADKSEANYYCQAADYIEVFKYILSADMEGIIINPGLEDYYVPRNVILNLIDDYELIKPELAGAAEYAFRL